MPTDSLVTRLFREPFSGLSHAAGALLSVLALIILVLTAINEGTAALIVGVSVFGVSLILLYSASALYHLLHAPPPIIRRLQKLDHVMIYVLIAGSYTPFCLVTLEGAWGWSILGVVWGLALLGAIMKLAWLQMPEHFSTLLYVGMGWVAVVAIFPLIENLSPAGFAWTVAGGVLYTVGAVFFALEPEGHDRRSFGFHEVFHLFVLAGSFSHFWAVWLYVR
jgi:hemolysin III